jgi:plasmid replication initiation protein
MSKVKKYEMTYNSEHYTVAANDIIRGKQSMTLQTARLIRLLITQVVKEDKDLKTYNCKITDLANFFNIPKNNLYRDIKQICNCAMCSCVNISDGNPKHPWKIFHWISTAEYDGNGTVTLRLSDQIKPYVMELEKWFTQYQLKNILEFSSYYAIRLYEIIKCEDGLTGSKKSELEFEISELRKYFDCEKKYVRISQFKEKVIEVAVREINEKSDILIYPHYKKSGRAITSISFEIHINYEKQK